MKPLQPLTEREKEIAALIVEGMEDQEIGRELWISVKTVKTHLANIRSKVGIPGKFGHKTRVKLAVRLVLVYGIRPKKDGEGKNLLSVS